MRFDPSLIELLTDMAVSTGHNLWDGISTVDTSFFKYLKLGTLLFLILIIMFIVQYVFRKFIKFTNNSYDKLQTVEF